MARTMVLLKRRILPALLVCLAALPGLAQEGPSEGGMGGGIANGRGVGGTITAISGSTFTLKTEEGDTYQVFTSANSRIMKNREPIKLADVHVGDAMMAGGEVDAKAKTVGAVFVAVLTPEQAQQARKMREDFGKTWTAGEVTAIKDTDITIKRRDNVAQTFTVNENTSFKKRKDSITMADIQVGDRLMAQGALKNGTFLATTVNVGRMGPGGGEGRGPGGQGHGASGTSAGASSTQPNP